VNAGDLLNVFSAEKWSKNRRKILVLEESH
jgi:hypothetical protein